MTNSTSHNTSNDMAIALIGMSGRFPGARNVEEFWQNVITGVKSIRSFSDEELLAADVDPALLKQSNYVKVGAVLEDADKFDAPFFKFSPREAEITDPQHRVFLECAWEALEDAGYDPETYQDLIGVFAGSAFSTYLLHNLFPNSEVMDIVGYIQASIGNDKDSLASTVSYKLNLRGPAIAVQTFCSTSLVATHLACQSLLNYECDIALAGGVAIAVPQTAGYMYEEGGILSPDGECRTFDANGRGSVMGNGVGVVALKRLEEALQDGDQIYAVVLGSAVNNDGSVRVSYTAPGLGGQTEVIAQALSNAAIDVETVGYVEAHGTATMLGDSVELAAMKKAFGRSTEKKQFCAIGSVKPNVGHLDRASGVTGLIKTSLALKHKLLPPSLNFEHASAEIDIDNSPFYVNTRQREWQTDGIPRRAGVSSFGVGGTNAHVVLEEAPEIESASPAKPWQLLLVSAKTSEALNGATINLATHLKTHADLNMADAAYTLQVGRAAFNYRRFVVCRDQADAIAALEIVHMSPAHTAYQVHRERPVAFLLPDQGEQYAHMAQELYQEEPVFQEAVDRCATFLHENPLSIVGAISRSSSDSGLDQSAFFVFEYALAQLLMQWGIRPQALPGSGVGEYVAACLAGIFSVEDALTVVTRRAQLMQDGPQDTFAEELAALLQTVTLNPPEIPYLSNRTGTWLTAEQAVDATYWVQHMCQPGDVAGSITQLLHDSEYVLLEVGPGQSLATLIRQHPAYDAERIPEVIATMPTASEHQSARASLLTALGQLWLAGVTVEWPKLYSDERRLRVSLPTYPFERQRHWLEAPRTHLAETRVPARPQIRKELDKAHWFYRSRWEQTPLPEGKPLAQQSWLAFLDVTGLGEQVVQELLQQGHSVVRVYAGTQFAQLDEHIFQIRPRESSDYTRLCDALMASGQFPRRVLHCWSVTGEVEMTPSDAPVFQAQQEQGFYSLLFLTQALAVHTYETALQMIVVSTHVQTVTGHELLQPEKATILGACKVISQEPLNISCRSIDLELPATGNWQDMPVVAQLVAECTLPVNDLVVAYRAENRWVQNYEAISLPPVAPEAPLFRQQGVYLITGGLGGIGLTLADYLARTRQARVVLVGRSGIPQRGEWQAWLDSHDSAESISQKIRQLQAIEAHGGQILVCKADVADPAQMRSVVQETLATFGGLHGVFHAAGITAPDAFKTIQDIARDGCEIHFQSKVYGTYALEQALEGLTLDFCLLFSSLSAVLGGLGFVAYTAANIFLDAFVARHNQTAACPWISVNWDTWQVREDVHGSLGATVLAFAMSPEEGIEALTRALASGATHLVNSTGDLQARIGQWIRLESLQEVSADNTQEQVEGASTAPVIGENYEPKIAEIWQQVLGVEQVGLYDNFFDLGGNSLVALDVISRLKKALHMQIPAVALFEAPTVSVLAKYLRPTPTVMTTEAGKQRDALIKRRRQAKQATQQEGIAIIGMSGRFPGATTIDQFWQNLRDGVESITRFDDADLLAAGVDPQDLRDPDYVKARPVLDQVDQFDANFFGYSPREAELTDPQHRLFLECSWEAFEQAGYDTLSYEGLIGVFGGTNMSTYLLSLVANSSDILRSMDGFQLGIGNDKDSLTTTVSYKLNLRGPSFAVQTFCSTSLVATHLACQSLLHGECDIALAGGVSIRVPDRVGYWYQEGGQESADGHCRTFDAQSQGSVLGDGVGVVVLKRLSEALEDGDTILAVIKGSAINNDGSLKVSYSAPSVTGQAEVVTSALANAGIDAESISYIEAHGTATELGDPIEVASLTKAFRSHTDKVGYCAIGSLKTNMGHLDRASGVAGLIKAVLALQHEQIPASLHYQSPNPEIDFEHSPFYVNSQLRPWPRTETPRRAGVNSLGMGGTNVHIVVEEAPELLPSSPSRPWQMLLLSAKTETALQTASHNLQRYLQTHAEADLADVAYTLQVGRSVFDHRRMLLCRNREDAIAALESADAGREYTSYQSQRNRAVAFMFPDGDEQFAGVTLELYQQEAAFRETVDHCCTFLKQKCGLDLFAVLYPAEVQDAAQGEQTTLAHLTTFIIEYALAQLLMLWGIRPQAMLGSQLGEYVAACLAGVFSLEDALTLVMQRAALHQRPVGLTEAGFELPPSLKLNPPQISFISHVTGTWITVEEALNPSYWLQYISQDVCFADGVTHLLQDTEYVPLEVGPGQSLSSLVKQHPAYNRERVVIATLAGDNECRSSSMTLLNALGQLWLAGVTPDWVGFYAGERRRRIPLPTYPFERRRYWLEARKQPAQAVEPQVARKLIARTPDIADWFYRSQWQQVPLTEIAPPAARYPWLIFMDSSGLGAQIGAKLSQQGYLVVGVHAGEAFAQLDEHTFSIRPGEGADYVKLCEALVAAKQLPRRVLHCWGVTVEARPTGSSTFRDDQELGFYSLLFLTRSLSAHVYDDPVQIIALTTHTQVVTGKEVLRPEKATIVAACKVIPQEPLNIACRSIDVDVSASDTWVEHSMVSMVEQLVAECTRPTTDLFVAYREGIRWIQYYEAVALPPVATTNMPFRQHGVYLITGGLGGIGLALAEHLARTVQARVVLLGRSGLPSRQEWQDWVATHADDDSVSQKIRRLQAIEALGGEVQVYRADVANTAQMQAVVKEVLATFGALNGVFHAAGIVDESVFKSVQDIARAECEIHFQSKVHGTYVLAQALQGVEIDFCLLFSSLSAVLGGLGFVAYTAANMFLDAFAHQHNATKTAPWISVNWDTWQVRENPHGSLGGTIAAFAMQPTEAIDALTRALASGNTHLVNSTGDLHARLQQWIRTDLLQESNASLFATKQSSNLIPSSGDYEQKITEVWQEVLGIQDVGLYDNFFDLGGNSLIALEVINKLKKAFHTQIPAVALFEAPTISLLTAYLQPAPELKTAQAQDVLVERRQQTRQANALQGVAIIGMSGRFPGAASVEQFWQNLSAGVESISFFTPAELEAAGVDPALIHAPNYVPARPVLPAELVEYFDAAFFGYSPREAELTDPQHRLFLECAWEALELAGYDSQTYAGLIGVFGGTNISTYVLSADPAQLGGVNNYQLLAGNDKDSLTSSVSYKLNLRGPSLAVQTFCSTSLVAVHLASGSLLNGECDLALAGGVSVQVPSIGGHLYEPGGMESPDGHCRTFDAQAHGSMFGDGVGVVVLKRLSDAVADGDVILAVVKGSAINNDGSLKVSYAAPSVVGQSEVVQAALANAGVSAESISYVEAHGTATELGDPIEVTSLTRAFSSQTEKMGYCAIGSVKTNVGHLDRAAGVSGLIKTVLSLQHEQIPASLHYQSPNPEIDFAHSPFYVNTQLRPWPRTDTPRRAGINSLGMGGTNAHVVLEEAPAREPSGPSRPWQLLLFSARTTTALAQVQRGVGDYLRQHQEISLADVAYTLQVGRRRFEQRSMLLCRDREEAVRLLAAGELLAGRAEQRIDRPVAFLFPGIGEQYIGMTQELYQQEDTFRAAIDRCCTILKGILDVNICDVLFSDEMLSAQNSNGNGNNYHDQNALNLRALLGRDEGQNGNSHNGHTGHNGHNGHKGTGALENAERLKQTALGQPIMFVIEYALAQLLLQWGIRPQAMLGYSLGEYVAACLAGVLSLEDALLLVARRAQFISELPGGAMIAVSLSEEDACIYTDENVSLAVVNSPNTCVLAGSPQSIEDVVMQLEWNGVAFRYVEATHAFHSTRLEPLQAQVTTLVRTLTLNPPTTPYISNVTGTWITAEQATNPDYWAQHMCRTVRFADGVSTLLKDTEYVLLEVGPGQSLASFVKQNPHCDRERASLVISTLPTVYERQPEHTFLLQSLGKLWLSGVTVDWRGFYAGERRLRVPLPTYPFERQRYWLEPRKERSTSPGFAASSPKDAVSALKKEELADWFYLPGWKHSAPVYPIDAAEQDTACWLLFLDHGSIGMQLEAQLRVQSRDVITVSSGEQFARLSDTHYSVHPRSRADYDALLKDMRLQGKTLHNIVHTWMVTGEQPESEEVLDKGFYSLFVLAQALGDADLEQCCITVISSEMQNVTGNEQICPTKSTLIGPCRVIPQEYPNLSCRSIDIVVPAPGSWQEGALLRKLQAELLADASDTVVALRGNRRWIPSFEPMHLDESSQQLAPLRQGGVYLITGGLGGIGLAMAKHLAREVQARLVLVGRTGLPPRQDWPAVLASQGESEGIGRRIREVLELETLGAEVLVIQADVTNEAHMREAVEQAVTTFGALSGVLHAAGIPGIGLTQLKTPEQAAQVLAPKVQGALVLERVLRDHTLDFLVLFSSVTSTTGGGPGQIDYCAANAFLDAFAYSHAGKPGVTIAIDWGEWQWNAWEAGLTGYDFEVQSYLREHRQKFGIAFEDGYGALRRALSTGLPHVVVSTQDFRSIAEQSKLFTAAYILQQEREMTSSRAAHPRPELVGSYVPPRNASEQHIVSLWEELLGISPVGVNDNFFELGGNSLTGIDLIARLRKAFNLETLPSHVLYEAPSVSAMALYIEKGKTTESVKERVERGEKRRDSLKQRMRETRRTR